MANENNQEQAAPTGMAALAAKEGEIITAAEQAAAEAAAGNDQAQQDSDYVAPEVEKVDGQEDPQESEEQPETPATPAPGPAVKAEDPATEANLTPAPAKLQKADMVNANGTAVTAIFMARLAKHIKHIRGELGFASKKEQYEEQVSWMETVGRSTGLDFEEFKLVTDALIRAIIDNKEAFRNGDHLRFNRGLAGQYPIASINRYEAYMTFLTQIATNWATRHRLKNQMDVGTVIADMKKVGKQNVTKYFNALVAAK